MDMQPIAHIHSQFPQKFGIPRQSGLAPQCKAAITFDAPFNDPQAVRGLEGYSHIWLIWRFDNRPGKREIARIPELPESTADGAGNGPAPANAPAASPVWRPLVRPPRLGGNKKMGVFATRSPYRPNPIGLSAVRLDRVEMTANGPVLHVSGADLRDGTAIFDIKPYLPLADCIPEATGGFTDTRQWQEVTVRVANAARKPFALLKPDEQDALVQTLAQDPRPARDADPEKEYKMAFGCWDVRFRVNDADHALEITDIVYSDTLE